MVFAAAVAVVVAAFAVFGRGAPSHAGQVASYDEVVTGLGKGDILLVDVREPDEFVAGHVPGAINLPLSRFDPAALPKPADKKVVVMCRSGNRSGKAMAMFAGVGRSDVADYSGSMIDWSRRGGPIVQGK
jgi:rhodanese-related sulfurtransferase